MCVKSALLCFSATVVPEAFHSPTVVQNSLVGGDTITHCSDAMRYGELPALHTKAKCVRTVHVCVQPLMKTERKRDCQLCACWLACLSQQGGATAN